MDYIQYSIFKRETGTAGGKAKNDAFEIMTQMGFKPSYKPSKYRTIRVIQQFLSITFLKKNTCLFIQYPAIAGCIMKILGKKLKKIRHSICLIHDLTSVQGTGGNINEEISFLNKCEFIICHNKNMKEFLLKNGCTSKIHILSIFDYLSDFQPLNDQIDSADICFAGNLDKSSFTIKLGELRDVHFNLYGVSKTLSFDGIANVSYKGVLSSNEIVEKIVGKYGLVWDGSSIDTCDEIYGKYLRLNCPHKLSLYICSGKPVIVWDQSAIADFVVKYNLGIVVSSLREIDLETLNANYESYRKNVLKLSKQISSGYYLKFVINEIIKEIQYEK